MFAKVSLNSFIYDMIDVFCFPNVTVGTTLKNSTSTWIWPRLTVVASSSFSFVTKQSDVWESESRKTIFEVLKQPKIAARQDVSHELWLQFKMHNPKVKKTAGTIRDGVYT